MTSAHLYGYHPGSVINVTGGKKFPEIIASLFCETLRLG